MKMKQMAESAAGVADLMKTLSHPGRLLMLCHLVEGEKSVGELARLVGMRETAVSQQLSSMRKEGLVLPRRDGQTIYYSLARPDVARLMTFLYDEYCGV